jgi:N-glycosylase/DNA lyase
MVDITTKIEINPDDLIKMLKDTDEKRQQLVAKIERVNRLNSFIDPLVAEKTQLLEECSALRRTVEERVVLANKFNEVARTLD